MTAQEDLSRITAQRLALHSNGYSPVPIYGVDIKVKSAGKRPVMNDWRTHCSLASPPEIERWARAFPFGTNTGILCGQVVGVDIDVLHSEVRDKIYALAIKMLGATPLERVGREPKILLVYRVAEAHAKLSTDEFFFDDDTDDKNIKAKVEILAEGQQFVGFGPHPETLKPYRWIGKTPLEIPAQELPIVTYEQLTQFRDEAAQILRDCGARTRSQILKRIEPVQRGAASYNDRGPASYEDVESAVLATPNILSREDYVRMGYSIYAAAGEAGRPIFMEFAARHPTFDRGNAESDWKSFRKGRGDVTPGTLFHFAMEAGWRRPDNPGAGEKKPQRLLKKLPEEPLPLTRPLPPAEPYPIDALPPALRDPALAIHAKIESPLAMCAQAVLAAACLAVQVYSNVRLPMGQSRPVSCFFLSIAESGERKTATDTEATRAIKKRERELKEEYTVLKMQHQNRKDAWERCRDKTIKASGEDQVAMVAALDQLGPEPPAPLLPQLTFQEPTIEALVKSLFIGQPSVGIFNDEGSTFIGGHGLREDARIRMGGGLSQFWDGAEIKRNRAGDGWISLAGRRASIHLMVQPGVSQFLLSDPELLDQGLLSRCLVSYPPTAAGTRFGREAGPAAEAALKTFEHLLLCILRRPLPLAAGARNELDPPDIHLADDAKKLWWAFKDAVERELPADVGEYHPIKSLANKLAEHAARLAAIMALIENITATEVSAEQMAAGIKIAQYYASEALRLFGAGFADPELALAQRVLDWMRRPGAPKTVALRDIYKDGPTPVRGKATAERIVGILLDHGWLEEERRPSQDKRRETVLYHVLGGGGDAV